MRSTRREGKAKRAHRPFINEQFPRSWRARREERLCPPYDFFHSLVRLTISAVTASRIAEGVREKRGAGAGWVTPWRLTKIFRAAMCGCLDDSLMVRTGAKQTSVPSMILHHSLRALVLNTSASLC